MPRFLHPPIIYKRKIIVKRSGHSSSPKKCVFGAETTDRMGAPTECARAVIYVTGVSSYYVKCSTKSEGENEEMRKVFPSTILVVEEIKSFN